MQMTTPDYGASARARQLVGRYLTDDNLLPVAALLTSEIVTNAMRHGQPGTDAEMQISCQPGRLRVEVIGTGPLEVRDPESEGIGGYGMLVIDRLSSRWGFERVAGNQTRMWFALETDFIQEPE